MKKPLSRILCGKKQLVAVYPDVTHPFNADAKGVGIEFDGLSAIFYEDQSDGYRSACEEPWIMEGSLFHFSRATTLTFRADVVVKRISTLSDDYFQITDAKNKQVVLKIGTANTDDYYPWFMFEWSPQNLSGNVRVLK